jgi:hypothetical protein
MAIIFRLRAMAKTAWKGELERVLCINGGVDALNQFIRVEGGVTKIDGEAVAFSTVFKR